MFNIITNDKIEFKFLWRRSWNRSSKRFGFFYLLREKISEKYLLSSSDAAEIILYFIKDNKKTYIINGNDFSKFQESNASTIYLDVNQNSKLYLNNASELVKDKQEKELKELNHKFNQFSKRKEKVEKVFEQELKEIN